ncbi:DUF2500 domain-containing protein [uncultured Oscillibacter sp.]|uniref:DUF2500 domain-containing protein n=1 Tax=uncultured Oscillibacter sp. TaxID=876091 RepID=UPI0025EFE39D|nr:DUF2500 domain-containing protein [uncultured Oscillibacter sp.]
MSAGFGMGGFGSLMFTFVPIFIAVVFVLVIGGMIVFAVRGVRTWSRNNASPRLTVPAQVVTKRTDVSHHHHHGAGTGMGHVHTSTWYYVTFQVESGDRMEFSVSGPEHGLLAEGDRGDLTFQGTRYLGFERS